MKNFIVRFCRNDLLQLTKRNLCAPKQQVAFRMNNLYNIKQSCSPNELQMYFTYYCTSDCKGHINPFGSCEPVFHHAHKHNKCAFNSTTCTDKSHVCPICKQYYCDLHINHAHEFVAHADCDEPNI